MNEDSTYKAAPDGAAIEAAARKMFRPQSSAASPTNHPPAGKVIQELENAAGIIQELKRDNLLPSAKTERPQMLAQDEIQGDLQATSGTAPANGRRAASPVMIARLCQEAGFPEMTANLLAMPHSRAEVVTKLEDAADIATAGRMLGLQPTMYRTLAASGVDPRLARKLMFDMKAEMDEAIQIDTSRPAMMSTPQVPSINPDAVYQHLNDQGRKV